MKSATIQMKNKFRYALFIYTSTISHSSTYHPISSTGFSLFHHYFHSTLSKSSILSTFTPGSFSFSHPAINLLASDRFSNHFFSSCVNFRVEPTSNLFINDVVNVNIDSMIIDVIKSDEKSMEWKLNLFVSKLSKFDIINILIRLNSNMMPALGFFDWLKNALPNYCRNADICSLVFANCGLLNDYDAMFNLLVMFRDQQICLSEKAFGFLPISSSDVDIAKKSIDEIVRLLNEVGGSCCNSGLHSLVRMLCLLNSIELARYVIQISERRVSLYCILVKHMCARNRFEDARDLIEEMWRIGCGPDSKTYNHLISCMCNQGGIDEALLVLREMLDRGCLPDMLTFEILIHFSCRYRCLDKADMLYNRMVSRGFKPRLSTHYVYIRGCFRSQQFEEAYIYVKRTGAKDKSVAQDIYNLLANLHVKHGDLLVAHDLIAEMLGKGLRPKRSMFIRATKHLYQFGKADFAERLEAQYEKLHAQI